MSLSAWSWTARDFYVWGRPIAGIFALGSFLSAVSYGLGGDWVNGLVSLGFFLAALCCILGITAHKDGKKEAMTGYIAGGTLALLLSFGGYLLGIILDGTPAQDAGEYDVWILGGVVAFLALITGVTLWVMRRQRKMRRRKTRGPFSHDNTRGTMSGHDPRGPFLT